MKKALYLFLALLLPGLIFVFLKYAGKNEFTVPIFYEEGIAIPRGCGFPDSLRVFSFDRPGRIDSALRMLWKMDKEVNVLVFPDMQVDFNKVKLAIDEEMGEDLVWFSEAASLTKDTQGLEWAKKCEFLMEDPFQAVLIDKLGRIRGYYDLRKREEVDKLRVELKILLKKY